MHTTRSDSIDLRSRPSLLSGSGVQVVDSLGKTIPEGWNEVPNDRRRLLSLLTTASPIDAGVLILSGDVHHGEIALTYPCQTPIPPSSLERESEREKEGSEGLMRPLLEVTASGMTHAWGDATILKYFGNFGKWLVDLILKFGG